MTSRKETISVPRLLRPKRCLIQREGNTIKCSSVDPREASLWFDWSLPNCGLEEILRPVRASVGTSKEMAILSIIALAFILLCSIIALLRWNEVRYGKKGLPPGTMGWPVFGETPDFIKSGKQFIKSRRARYGKLFKSHILGCPTVISTDPAPNRYILLNEGRGLIPGYPRSMLDILGKCNIAAVQNSLQKTMRGVILALINPSMSKDHLLSDINNFMDIHLQHWNGHIINLQDKTKEMALLCVFEAGNEY